MKQQKERKKALAKDPFSGRRVAALPTYDEPGPLEIGKYRTEKGQQYTRFGKGANEWRQTSQDEVLSWPIFLMKGDKAVGEGKGFSKKLGAKMGLDKV